MHHFSQLQQKNHYLIKKIVTLKFQQIGRDLQNKRKHIYLK